MKDRKEKNKVKGFKQLQCKYCEEISPRVECNGRYVLEMHNEIS